MDWKTSFDYDSIFQHISIHCPICAELIFITMTPVFKKGKATVETKCPHAKFSVNDESYTLDMDFMGNNNGN